MSSRHLLSGLARKRLDRVRSAHADTVGEDREAIAKGGLLEFTRRAWHQIDNSPFRENWHHGLVAEHLEAVTSGDMPRLVINEPPGCSKTLMCSVLWNAWAWAEVDPDLRWIYTTYADNLSRRDAVKTLNLINSDWYRARWPHVKVSSDSRSAKDFRLDLGGWRFSTTPGGQATGRHPDIQVVDDPTKPKDTKNRGGGIGAQLGKVAEWWRDTMATRARDQATLRRVIVMQRLHDLDLAGEMLREGGYEHLRLPMRFEINDRARTYVTINGVRELFGEDPRTEDGELLDPVRFPLATVNELERTLGPSVAAAQLQQRPTQAGGGIFRTAFFAPRWTKLPRRATWIQSWDMRFKDDAGSGDWVVGGVWCVEGADIYAVDQVRGRWGFLETVSQVLELSKRYPLARLKLIENKANGPAVVNTLKRRVSGLVLVEPQGGKIDRANGIVDMWEAGNVYLPAGSSPITLVTGETLPPGAPWVPGFVHEHLAFPRGAYDDQVDQATQALARLRSYNVAGYAGGVEALAHVTG